MTTTLSNQRYDLPLTTPRPATPARPVSAKIAVWAAISHSFTMAYRGLLKIRHNPEQLFDVTLQPILFTVMFTYLFGGSVSGSVENYLPLIIPGILVQTVLMTSIVTGTQLRDDMNKGVFDRFTSLPIARIAALAGALLADSVRYGIATALTLLMGLIMGYRPAGGAAAVLLGSLLVVVCSFAISWIFATMGLLMKKVAGVQGISMLIMFPLTFVSPAFVPAATMPGWLQIVVDANPVTHIVYATRDLFNAGHIGAHFGWSLAGAAAIVAVFAPLTVRLYMRQA